MTLWYKQTMKMFLSYLMPLYVDPVPDCPALHPVLTLPALLREGLLHGVAETRQVLPGPALQVVDPARQAPVRQVQVAEHLTLVLIHLPFNPAHIKYS